MTESEKQEIVNRVLSALSTNSSTIDQMMEVYECVDDDYFETNKGNKVSFGVIRKPFERRFSELSRKIDVFRNVCSRFESLNNESELPENPSEVDKTIGYIINKELYLYVGTGGNVLNGKYINVGAIVGPQGEVGPDGPQGLVGPVGPKGDQGNSGVSGSTDNIVVVNDLNGGESTPEQIKVLSAEQGKVLKGKFDEIGKRINELNISALYPTSGIDGSNRYDLAGAIAQVSSEYRVQGVKVSFVDEGNNTESWEYKGGTWAVGRFAEVGERKITEIENSVEAIGSNTQNYEEADFGISDEKGNVLVQFSNGHIKTKNFDSSNINNSGSSDDEGSSNDGDGIEITEQPVNTYSYTLNETIIGQKYLGGYIEIQPDSWDGSVPSTDSTSNLWGFPYSLLFSEIQRASECLGNIQYVRFPLGFAYRGLRNIDESTQLNKNIGERFSGQNYTLKMFFEKIIKNGGGLAPEYWCLPQYWITSGEYSGSNQVWAGGDYPRSTTLASIKSSDTEQYNKQIDELTNAIVDDLEYLHTEIAPVKMFGLSNEPQYSQIAYGACGFDDTTYSDILSALVPKIKASEILSNYNGVPNNILIHVSSSDTSDPWSIGSTFIKENEDYIWGYTHHHMRNLSGESSSLGADIIKKTTTYQSKNGKPVFCNEYEYFTSAKDDNYRCSNMMLKMLNEFCFGASQVAHPIIHIAKPHGQTLTSTNTKGYCLLIFNKDDEIDDEYKLANGTFTYNTPMYNAWSFVKNLPIGAYFVGDSKITDTNGMQFCVFKHAEKLYVLAANRNDVANSIKITFSESKTFEGELYNISNNNTKLKQTVGKTIDFVIPAYSGVFYRQL